MNTSRFARFAWAVLAYNLVVILWGALVRATGSGAGCGAHWPTCQGAIIPQATSSATVIEFTHRVMSGLVMLLALALLVWAFRAYPKGHVVRLGAVLVAVFTVTEALVGAGLVLFELVAENTSVARAFAISIHLVNTFFLLASLTLTGWWASGGRRLRLSGRGGTLWLFVFAWIGMFFIGTSGAVTALGDTLFPAGSLAEGLQQDISPTVHFLIRLRIYHPIIAVLMGVYITLLGASIRSRRKDANSHRLSVLLIGVFLLQLGIGAVNVVLLAPVWMQLIHLLTADLTWILLIALSAYTFQVEPQANRVDEPKPVILTR